MARIVTMAPVALLLAALIPCCGSYPSSSSRVSCCCRRSACVGGAPGTVRDRAAGTAGLVAASAISVATAPPLVWLARALM
ncbi:hypothetical protein [Luteitalea pratensis]|uniref:hypothetical protein n=1 Tax=Luteitalea pratensis TaxID=1855912 RepID=UPI000D73B11F|nr:hypothetical protein [Luteitalea pratensis]